MEQLMCYINKSERMAVTPADKELHHARIFVHEDKYAADANLSPRTSPIDKNVAKVRSSDPLQSAGPLG